MLLRLGTHPWPPNGGSYPNGNSGKSNNSIPLFTRLGSCRVERNGWRSRCRVATASGTEEGVTQPRVHMIAWDIDNIFPQKIEHIDKVIDGLVASLFENKRLEEGGTIQILLSGNTASVQRICNLSGLERNEMLARMDRVVTAPQSCVDMHMEFIEAPKRKNAVDRVLEQRMVEFSKHKHCGCICCISNDGDFENTLRYCSYQGSFVISIGTVRGTRNNTNWSSKRHNKKLADSSDDAWRLEIDSHMDTVCISRYE